MTPEHYPDVTEWSWLAGITDGEGAVQLGRSKQGSRVSYKPSWRVDMTHEPTISKIASILERAGFAYNRAVYVRKNVKHRTSNLIWVTTLPSLTVLLARIYPYSITKRDHVRVLAEFVHERLKQKGILKPRDSRGRIVSTYTGVEEEFFLRLKELNKRGA